jgi:hypothetical protein
MKKIHEIKNLQVKKGVLSLIVGDSVIRKKLDEISPIFANANKDEQEKFTVSPSGYGIHWSLLDEDVSIDGLLGIVHNPTESEKSA